MEEVGKHVHSLESSQTYRNPETGEVQTSAGGISRMLMGGRNDTAEAAQAFANVFHNRGGRYVSQVEQEAKGGDKELPERNQTFTGKGTESTISHVDTDRPAGAARAGQTQRDRAVPATTELPEGPPIGADRSHLHVAAGAPTPGPSPDLFPRGEPGNRAPGEVAGSGAGLGSYTRNAQYAGENPDLYGRQGGNVGLQIAPPPPGQTGVTGTGEPGPQQTGIRAQGGDGSSNPGTGGDGNLPPNITPSDN
jgi:hypothetical protein